MVDLVTALEQAHRESPSWRLYGLCHQAATRIAELAAENERLKQRLADHTRATSTVDAHETANVSDKPEGQQEPVARGVVWFGYDENTGEFTGEYCSVKPHDARGMRPYIPYTTRPSEQAVTEAMVGALKEARSVIYDTQQACLFDDDDGQIGVTEDAVISSHHFQKLCRALGAVDNALKAAMEAGR